MSEDEDVDQFLRVEQDMALEQSLEQQQPPNGVGERVGAQAAEVPSVRTRNQGRQNVNYQEDSDSSDEEPARVRRTTNGDQNVFQPQPTFTPTRPASNCGDDEPRRKSGPNPAARGFSPSSTPCCAEKLLTSPPGLARLLELRPRCCTREPRTTGQCLAWRMVSMARDPFSPRA